jgi:hypothetical protein
MSIATLLRDHVILKSSAGLIGVTNRPAASPSGRLPEFAVVGLALNLSDQTATKNGSISEPASVPYLADKQRRHSIT